MDSAQRGPREMTDGEVINWMQELVHKLTKEKGSAGGACSLEALRNPIRRRILDILKERALARNEIAERLEITGPALKFHINFLESAHFIRVEGNKVDLTPGGVSVVRSHKWT